MNFIIGILILVTLVLEGINIFLANQVSTESVSVARLNQEIEELEDKNYILKTQILEYAALDSVASRAAQLGFADNKTVISLYEPATVAIR